jgi:hypothetical protein
MKRKRKKSRIFLLIKIDVSSTIEDKKILYALYAIDVIYMSYHAIYYYMQHLFILSTSI